MKKIKRRQLAGFSLVEAMIAIAIFAMMAASLVSLSVGALNPWLTTGGDLQGSALAEEALEAVRSIQARAWNELIYSVSGVTWSGSQWQLSGEGTKDVIDNYTRQLFFYPVCRDVGGQIAPCPAARLDPNIIAVKAVVTWQPGFGPLKTVVRQVYLSNWAGLVWQQNNWLGGAGQVIWLDATKYDSDQNIDATSTVGVQLAKQADGSYWPNGWLMSSAFNLSAPSKIQVIDWLATTTPTSSVQLQVRAAPDNGGLPGNWSAWYGAGGADTFFTDPNGSLISRDLNGNQWLQYRAELNGNVSSTPTLISVRLNYK